MKSRYFFLAASIILSGCNSDHRKNSCEVKIPEKGAYPKIHFFAMVDPDGFVNILSKQCGLWRASVFISFEQRERIINETKYSHVQGTLNYKLVEFDAIVIRQRLGKRLVVYKVENFQIVNEIPEWLKPMYN